MESSLHFDDVLLRSNIYETAGWPSLAKFRKFGNIFKSLCNFLSGYSRCCTLNFWTYFLNFLKQFFTLVNGPMLNNNDLAIWSHWRTVLLAYHPFHSQSRWSGHTEGDLVTFRSHWRWSGHTEGQSCYLTVHFIARVGDLVTLKVIWSPSDHTEGDLVTLKDSLVILPSIS